MLCSATSAFVFNLQERHNRLSLYVSCSKGPTMEMAFWLSSGPDHNRGQRIPLSSSPCSAFVHHRAERMGDGGLTTAI